MVSLYCMVWYGVITLHWVWWCHYIALCVVLYLHCGRCHYIALGMVSLYCIRCGCGVLWCHYIALGVRYGVIILH